MFEGRFVARYIRDEEAFADLANISRTRIKIGLQYFNSISYVNKCVLFIIK